MTATERCNDHHRTDDVPDMTTAKHRRRTCRPNTFARTALALAVVSATGAGVFTGFVVDRPAPAGAATVVPVAPITPPPVPLNVPPTTSAAPTSTAAPRATATKRSTTAAPRRRTSSVPATPRTRYTEDQLRERSENLTTDDIMAGRGSMPDGGLTSGETQLRYLCQRNPSADYC